MMNITTQVQRIVFTYPAQMTIKPMRMIVSDKRPISPASFAFDAHGARSSSEAGGYIARTFATSDGMTDTSAIEKSTLDTKTKSRRICKQHLTFSQDFHFAVLVWCRLYIQPLPLEAFLSFPLSRTTSAAQEGPSWPFRVKKNPEVQALHVSVYHDEPPENPAAA